MPRLLRAPAPSAEPPLFAAVAVRKTLRGDGGVLLDNALELGPAEGTLLDRLHHWARVRPHMAFLTEADEAGRRTLTYGGASEAVRILGARILALPVSTDRPLMILGANSLDHALAMLAATSVGVPAAIVSPAYATPAAAPWNKLARVLDTLDPGLVLADDPTAAAEMFEALGRTIPVRPLRNLAWLYDLAPEAETKVAAARASVTSDTVAKLMLTSGSTGAPKAVINTQRMMISNMAGLGQVWPFLGRRPPILVDWLPWNHTFGGNCCFNLALVFGGTLHIDDGRPTPAHVGRTVAALRKFSPTAYFNVPSGYDALLPHLEADRDLASRFLGGLDVLFNAGAALPDSLRDRLAALSHAVLGRKLPIVGGWGSTETAPFSTVVYFDTEHASNLGAPLPGVTLKLTPGDGRMELRVRGPNVTPGYWRQPEATAAAFDEEGFYRIGDAGRFADPHRPEAGVLFNGRIAENFKLSTGTWVNVSALRLALIAALSPLVTDIVIAGEGRGELAALLFPAEDAGAALRAMIVERLNAYNAGQFGSSMRVSKFAMLTEPPSAAHDEITEKGYLNQRAVLRRRAAIVDALFDAGE